MKICLICVEIFAWGKYGGFGRSARMLGRELARRGIDVTAVVPRRAGQEPVEMLDGIRVLGFDPAKPLSASDLYREVDADIYHSQEPSFGTFLAHRSMPHRKHIVTFRDTRDLHDWWIEFLYPSLNHAQVVANFIYEDNFLVHGAIRKADAWFTAAHMLIPKARKKYRLPADPEFIPSPIPFPETIEKSDTPLVCFVARMDKRKRPHIFFELARHFPDVQFAAVGAGRDRRWESELRARYSDLANLTFHGFVDQFRGTQLSEILGRSWVLINTSAREGLPTSFIEAAGHGCGILSEIDPDGFASRFGYWVRDGDYRKGLEILLNNDLWREKAAQGMQYARHTFALDTSIQHHLQMYENLRKR